jgi:tetratricopeptide (TPR) repeat protein
MAIPSVVFSQYRHIAADDEALCRSSVAWNPSVSALYSNPAGISYVRQTECAVSNHHLFQTTFLGVSYFDPSIGTIAAGGFRNTGDGKNDDILSLGIAHEFFSSFSFGVTAGGKKRDLTFIPAFGIGFLFRPPGESILRDLSLGAFLQNVTIGPYNEKPFGGFGAAYWFMNDRVRVQTGYTVSRQDRSLQFGVEGRLLDWLSLRAGTDRGKDFCGGISLVFPFIHIDAAVENSMLLLTFTPRLGTAWFEKRDKHFTEGIEFYRQQRYNEAIEEFDQALMYDRNYSPAREYRMAAQSDYHVKVEEYFERGQLLVIKNRFRDAIQMFQIALAINPTHDSSQIKLAATKERLRTLIDTTFEIGRRYRTQRQYRQAHAMFQRILEFDSTVLPARIALAQIDSERIVVVDSLLRAGETAMRQSLFETARSAIEKAITIDPGNSSALRRLGSLNEKLTLRELLEEGKKQLAHGETHEALSAFRIVLEKNPDNDEAKKYVAQCLTSLRSTVDTLYQKGQRAYSNEEYETAIGLFTRVITIDPDHKSAQEYLQRSNDRLKALEQLR